MPFLWNQVQSRPGVHCTGPLEMKEVERQVTDLLAKGLIEKSTSPFGAPLCQEEER